MFGTNIFGVGVGAIGISVCCSIGFGVGGCGGVSCFGSDVVVIGSCKGCVASGAGSVDSSIGGGGV